MRQYQILVSGKNVNLITREGCHWLKQWWHRTWGPGFSTRIWGILEDDVLWMSHEEAVALRELGLQVDALMFPGSGPNGFVNCINIKKEKGIIKIYEPDISGGDKMVVERETGKEWMMNEKWRPVN